LSFWAEQGATILLPRGARVAIERQLRARGLQGELRIEEVDDRRSFGSGANRIDAYAFASSHAAAHMVMHLPERRMLFQGDLFYLPERGDPPAAFPVVRELERLIARLGLKVDLIVGVHGRPATMAQMRQSLRRPLRRQR
jgi:glyoxylase-like metal-dependent hydrolase (beta-lactamase superfamily II)